MTKAFAALYIAAVLALAVTAVLIFQLRCENFGCMGVGVAWFAWAGAFVPVLAIGCMLRRSALLGVRLLGVIRAVVWTQAASGAALLTLWVSKNVV